MAVMHALVHQLVCKNSFLGEPLWRIFILFTGTAGQYKAEEWGRGEWNVHTYGNTAQCENGNLKQFLKVVQAVTFVLTGCAFNVGGFMHDLYSLAEGHNSLIKRSS